jgi:phosphatidylinositol alpha-mannosyltransferase
VTVHGITGFSFYESKFLWFFFKIGLLLSNKIISVSISDKKLLDKEFSNVIYLPNGVDTGLYKKISHLKIEKKITFIGRIHEQKGLAFLIPAFLKLKKEYPNYRLEIIGKTEGPLYGRLSKQYQDKSIVWRGFILERKEIFSSLKSAEILVFPSQWEALPWPALLEGLGSGRPVIASELEGMRNIFSDKKNIVLIKKADPQEIYFSIKGLIKNKKLANKIGAAGKKKAEQFSWANTCVELHNVYNSI